MQSLPPRAQKPQPQTSQTSLRLKGCLREFWALRIRVLRAGPTQNAALQKEHGRRRKACPDSTCTTRALLRLLFTMFECDLSGAHLGGHVDMMLRDGAPRRLTAVVHIIAYENMAIGIYQLL
ncbi:hypothetical protein COCSUDRAFT_61920 [Coccomyxa subellipsoidea C-169]|uniref:Uncharacterized protein n=1 Tax=Coccomyxa subellipsoidea (strain C-169) TaxID=574566 RepID=I0Z1H1_COCSC|nr:hypothetical protein COCSUDRAFT_61920 [Coccomyxa subellipsoidea C-169]EIE24490.1 hypothetical protein COCSUDRAFT_61920 [Coccomyxa subellipsoidea C-169]|eukprot:XP_005649034.1 hypothetical protein COCSUDRAFT_61920 [Coccomyxa subellipsoidea C-169]